MVILLKDIVKETFAKKPAYVQEIVDIHVNIFVIIAKMDISMIAKKKLILNYPAVIQMNIYAIKRVMKILIKLNANKNVKKH